VSDPRKTNKKPNTSVNRKETYDDEKIFAHESYGMVQFSRLTGHSGRLFGSSLPDQGSFIQLRVVRADRRHHLGRDWYHGEQHPLMELDLSNVQFAELLTTMNNGSGVPCTLRYTDGRQMEKPPEERLEAQQVRDDFKEKLAQVARNMQESMTKIDEVLSKKSIGQGDRDMIHDLLGLIKQDVASNIPFWLKSFHEATGKIVASAKTEIDAFLTNAVMSAGYKALGEGSALPITVPALLTEGESDGED
jgi:hypothetical protein